MKKLLIVLAFLLIASPVFASSIADVPTLSIGLNYNMLGESASGTSVSVNYPTFGVGVEIPTAKGQSVSVSGGLGNYSIGGLSVNQTTIGAVYKIEFGR